MQRYFDLRNIFKGFVTQAKQACFPESHRCDVHILVAAAGGFITVPAHPVTSIPVQIKQHCIKFNMGMLLYALPDIKEFDWPVGI
jgi:hypothetical protein